MNPIQLASKPKRFRPLSAGLTAMLLGILLCFAACVKEPGFGGKYSFRGEVTWSDTVSGSTQIAASRARLRVSFKGSTFTYEMLADDQGRFFVEEIHLGRNDTALLTAYATRTESGMELTYTDTLELTVDSPQLRDGDRFEGLKLNLTTATAAGQQSLDGEVYYQLPLGSDAIPASGLQLALVWRPAAQNPVRFTATTNSLGAYRFVNLPFGAYTLEGTMQYAGFEYVFSRTLSIAQGENAIAKDTMRYGLHIIQGTLQYQDLLTDQLVDFPVGSSVTLRPLPQGAGTDISISTDIQGRYQFKNIPSGQYQLQAQTSSASGLTYTALIPNMPTTSVLVMDQPVIGRHELPGTLIVQVVDSMGTPQAGSEVCCYSNASLWDSLPGCSSSLASSTALSPHGKAVFQGLYPGANFYFVIHKFGADTLAAADTIATSVSGPRIKMIEVR